MPWLTQFRFGAVISISYILVDAIPPERTILIILVANVMSEHQKRSSMQADAMQENMHIFKLPSSFIALATML